MIVGHFTIEGFVWEDGVRGYSVVTRPFRDDGCYEMRFRQTGPFPRLWVVEGVAELTYRTIDIGALKRLLAQNGIEIFREEKEWNALTGFFWRKATANVQAEALLDNGPYENP